MTSVLASLRPTAVSALALPGAAIVYFAFHAGGFFVGSQSTVALLFLVILALRVTTAADPLAGISRPLAGAAVALALYAAWILVSAAWSDAASRALLEFDRTLLYLSALLLFGSILGSPERLRWMLRLGALAIVAVCVIAVVTRLMPDLWPVSATIANDRLSYPVTYWNALGLLSALGIIFCLHLTSSRREPAAAKIAASAALPMLAVTLLFTFSRGAIVAGTVGLLAYVLIARPRALLSGLAASLPASAAAVAVAYSANLLATRHPTTEAAAAQGHRVALVLAICVGAAALLRLLLLRVDGAVVLRLPRLSPRAMTASAAAALSVAVALGVILQAPAAVGRSYDRFVDKDTVSDPSDFRQRLGDPSNSHRLELWRVSLDAFEANALRGQGAGTFQNIWAQQRPNRSAATDGHSLYLETLAELGIVGLLLLLAALVTIVVAIASRCRGPDRSVYAAVLGATIAWVLHAGVDWDWELPVVTMWLFAFAGAALAATSPAGRLISAVPARFPRVLIGIGLLVLAVTPARVAVSQARLTGSVHAFTRGDCPAAIDSALGAAAAAGERPEPYEVLGYCDSRLGLHPLAIRAMRSAVDRDPGNWGFHYGLAVVRAAAGKDPRPAARAALRLDPRGPLPQDLVRRFKTSDPRSWKRRAALAPLPGDL